MSTNKNSKKIKLPSTREFTLIKATSINGKLKPVGYKVSLTKESEIVFRKKNRIK